MPKIVPLSEMRKWLQEHEKGKTEAAIAKETRHDIRTIKNGIERASREKDARVARESLVKDSLRNHHDVLLGLVQDVHSAVTAPLSTESDEPRKMQGEYVSTSLGEAMAKVPTGKQGILRVDEIALSFEAKPEWELLKEHLGRDVFWKELRKWKEALAYYMSAKQTFRIETGAELIRQTGCKLESKSVAEPFLYASTALPLVFQVVVESALEFPDALNLGAGLVTDSDTGEVILTGGHILGKAPGEVDKLASGIVGAFTTLKQSKELEQVVFTWKRIKEPALKVKRAAEDILMLGIVPGQCRICRRLGM